jgi:hypothetical protein
MGFEYENEFPSSEAAEDLAFETYREQLLIRLWGDINE